MPDIDLNYSQAYKERLCYLKYKKKYIYIKYSERYDSMRFDSEYEMENSRY